MKEYNRFKINTALGFNNRNIWVMQKLKNVFKWLTLIENNRKNNKSIRIHQLLQNTYYLFATYNKHMKNSPVSKVKVICDYK